MSSVLTAELTAARWLDEGRRAVVATLVERFGSSPFAPGARMAFDDHGRVEGSVTGGCVEAALAAEAEGIFGGGHAMVARYGIADDTMGEVGLTCGGTVRFLVREVNAASAAISRSVDASVRRGEPVALATLISGEAAGTALAVRNTGVEGSLGRSRLLDRNVSDDAIELLAGEVPEVRDYGAELTVLIEPFSAPRRLAIVGVSDFSIEVAKLARQVGFRVEVCEARPAFAADRRLAGLAAVSVEWPEAFFVDRRFGPRDAVLVFSHDPKFDQPALAAALASGAGYIGALGSRRTQALRAHRLRQAGVGPESIARIHAPSGLDIGAATAAETAVSIMAEVIATRRGRGGLPLRETDGPIHGEPTGPG